MDTLLTLLLAPLILLGGFFGPSNEIPDTEQMLGVPVLTVPQGGTGASSFTTGECLKGNGTGSLTTGSCGSGGSGTVSTSTNETKGRLPYWTSTSGTPATLGEVATTSLTINAPLTTAGTAGALVGGTNLTIDIDDIKAADLDLTDITLNDFTNDSNFITDGNTNWDNSYGFTTSGYPFTATTNYGAAAQATTGIPWFQNGLQASTTSHFTQASSTHLTITNIWGKTNGGSITIDTLDAIASNVSGGSLTMSAGNGVGLGVGGAVSLTAGDGGASGSSGGDVSILAGRGRGSEVGTKGGDLILGAGDGTGGSAQGDVKLRNPVSTSNYVILNVDALTSTSRTLTFPDADGTLCLRETCATFSYPFPSNATTTLIAFNGGLSSASTTLTGNFVFENATGTNATTTSLAIINAKNGPLGTDNTGRVFASTTGAVTAGTGISLDSSVRQIFGGSLAISNSGVISGSCTGGTTCSGTNPLTINSFSYPFPSNATTTLINFNGGLTSASTTLTGPFVFDLATGTSATTTNLAVSGALRFNGVSGTTWPDFCSTITGSAALCDGNDATGAGGGSFPFSADTNYNQVVYSTSTPSLWFKSGFFASSTSYLVDYYASNGTTTNATSTNLAISGNLSFDSLVFDSLTDDATLDNNGGDLRVVDVTCTDCLSTTETDSTIAIAARNLTIAGTANQITSSAGAQDLSADRTWTLSLPNHVIFPSSYQAALGSTTAATSTNIFAGLLSASGARFGATATTTIDGAGNIVIPSGSNLTITGKSDGCATFASGVLNSTGSACGSGGGASDFTWTSTFNTLSAATSSSLWSQTRLFASSTVGAPNMLENSVFTNSTSTNATSTSLNVSGQVDFDGLTSALIVTGAGGILAEYTGAGCTTQVVEDISAIGGTTCVSINNDYWSGTDLSVANGGTGLSTFGGSNHILYTTAADTLSSEAAFTYSATTDLLTVVAATTTNLTAGSFFKVPTATSFSNNLAGTIHFDTTSGNLVMGTTTSSSANHVVIASATTTLYSFVVASTSPDFVSGGIIDLPPHFLAQKAIAIMCHVDGGTSQQIFLSDGTNDTNTITCTTTDTQYALNANNAWNAYEAIRLEFVTKSGSPDYLSVRVLGYRTTD